MLVVVKIAKIRRAYFQYKKKIKAICPELRGRNSIVDGEARVPSQRPGPVIPSLRPLRSGDLPPSS